MSTAAQVSAGIRQVGKPGTLRRWADSYDPATGDNTRTPNDTPGVPIHWRNYTPQELAGSVQQGDRQFRISPADLPAGLVPRRQDELLLADGTTWRIEHVDDRAGLGGETGVYIIQGRGGPGRH